MACKKSLRYCFLLLILCWFSLIAAQDHQGPKADIDQILANAKAFSAHVVAGNLEGILDAYTEDGKIFPNNRPIMSGRAALADYWRPQPGYSTTYHLLTPLEIKVTGDEARDHGHYAGRSVGPDGEERSWQGKYLVIWKKVDGDWKMYLDIWNGRPADNAVAPVGLPAAFRVLARPGLWVADGPQLGQKDGLTTKSFRTALGGKMVHVQTGTTKPETGHFSARNEGMRYWSAADSTWYFQEYDRDGGLTTGRLTFEDRNVYYDYSYQGTQLRDAWIYQDDTHYQYIVGMWDGERWTRKFHEGVFVFRPGAL